MAFLITTFLGGGVVSAIVILLLYIMYPDNFKKIVGHLAFIISYLFKKYEYIAIKNETEGKINSFVANFQSKLGIELPFVSVRWTSFEGEKEDILHEDYETIIVMRDRNHRNRNFVHAAYFFTSEIFLKNSKRHLSKSMKIALDLFATKEILKQESAAAVEQFVSDYMSPEVEKNDDVREYLKKFHLIEKLGVFFPILVQELSLLGKKVFLEKRNQEVIVEVKTLIQFLEGWANRKSGENIQELFIGKYMKCAIKIVATKQSRENYNVTNQKRRIIHAIQVGCENIYAIGRIDDDNKKFMDDVISAVTSDRMDLEVRKKLSYKASIKDSAGSEIQVQDYFIHIHNPKAVKNIIEE